MAELSLLAKATIVLALALMAARALRGARASVRALLLSSAFGAVLVLPAATWLMPERSVAVPIAYAENVALVLEQVDDSAPAVPVTGPRAEAIGPAWRLPPVATMLRALWVLVTIGLLFRLGMALWHLRSIRRTGVPWLDGADVVNDLAARAGLRRHVDVFVHEELSAPMTFGTLRPAIGLPPDTPRWDHAALHHALVHELEHVRRGDWPVYLAAKVACAVYWFHPLAWIAARQLCLEAERAADDAVLRDAEGTAYAEQLVSLARRLSRRSPVAVLSMAARSDLSTRVRALLDVHQARGRAGLMCAVVVVALAVAVTITLSPLTVVASPAPAFDRSPSASSQAAAAPVDVLVIDSVERPTSNEAPQEPQPTAPAAPTVTADRPAFEVASIRPSSFDNDAYFSGYAAAGICNPARARITGNQVAYSRATLCGLIRLAYGVQEYQIVRMPAWMTKVEQSLFYDIDTRTGDAAAPTTDQARLMLQTLLADRFQLQVRRESRELPVYALVVGPNGPKFTDDAPPPCPDQPSAGFLAGPGLFASCRPATTMAQLAQTLSRETDRAVVDRTGLTGVYAFRLEWTRDATAVTVDSRSSIFTAVQEQLGLRLEPRQEPVDALVIDRAEPPTAN